MKRSLPIILNIDNYNIKDFINYKGKEDLVVLQCLITYSYEFSDNKWEINYIEFIEIKTSTGTFINNFNPSVLKELEIFVCDNTKVSEFIWEDVHLHKYEYIHYKL